MNTERLLSLVRSLLADEETTKIQQGLESLNSALAALSNAPQDANAQIQLSERLRKLRNTLSKLHDESSPARLKAMESIGATRFFDISMVDGIENQLATNAMTPAVVHQSVAKLVKNRSAYLARLTTIADNLDALGIDSDDLDEGHAEIGFELPRSLFDNNLEGLINELRDLKRIIRAFSEATTGTPEPITVKKISTSDPIFFFELTPVTILTIGGIVTWVLKNWQLIETIRKTRAETQKIKAFTDDEIGTFFDAKIKNLIEEAITAKTNELLGVPDGKAGRKAEQRIDIAWALNALFARIERGMTVEIRALPPALADDDEGAAEDEKSVNQTFEGLREISQQLSFPAPEETPILQLPKQSTASPRPTQKSRRAKKNPDQETSS